MPVQVLTNVPYGNACDIHVTQQDGAAVVHFTPDPHGSPETMWFCFRVSRHIQTHHRKLRLVLNNLGNILGGTSAVTIRPVVRQDHEPWQRLPLRTPQHLPDGRVNLVWELDMPRTTLDVALCYPYGQPELQELLHDTQGYWKTDTIGVSQAGRPLIRLSNDYGHTTTDENTPQHKPGLYLLARQHSGETPGSWVLDGFLRHMAELGDNAPLIWCVPLTNIDGIEQGDYGKDNFPYDLNRAWGQPPMRHETLVFQRDMQRWRQRCSPVLVMDFHAPGAGEQDGMYFFIPPETEPNYHAAAQTWVSRLGKALGETYAIPEPVGRVARYASRWNTPNTTRYTREAFDILGVSIEVPYTATNQGQTLLTIPAYRQAGALMASAVATTLAEEHHTTRNPR